ncbi:MAG: LysR family transcriptional regulator [Pseudomonadota bacterium]
MWDNVRIFVKVARFGSFTTASTALHLSAATLARKVDALEAELGFTLFLRDNSGVVLTEVGQKFLQLIEPTSDEMHQVLNKAALLKGLDKTTLVRVSGTEPVIAEILAPNISGLFKSSPEARIDLAVENSPVNLSRFEAEIALRLAKPEGESLRVQRLATFEMGVWANRDLEVDLDRVRFAGYDLAYGRIAERAWLEQLDLAGSRFIQTASTRAILNIVCSGAAIGVLPSFISRKYPRLVKVHGLPKVPPRHLWMLMHPEVARMRSVREVADWIISVFRSGKT